jgi:phosphatidate cytidylyltransferase
LVTPDTPPPTGLPRDFGVRLVSGLVLAAVALGLTFAGVWAFAALVLAVALIVAWEWGRIVRGVGIDTIFVVHAATVIAAVALAALGLSALAVIAVLVGAILAGLLGFGQLGHISALGVLYAGLPAIALMWLRGSNRFGLEAIVFLFLVVWASDTAAYAAGRTFGGPKLMPSVSPKKTWSGLVGALVGGGLVGALFAVALPGFSAGVLIPTGIGLALMAQMGDLMESALKRWHDVKDASSLIPGHGGFMDRVDGLIFAAIVAALFAAFINFHAPARALLSWG